jgi:hypothetical protein
VRDDPRVRVEGGAVVDEFDVANVGHVAARHTRLATADGVTWACMFTIRAPGHDDLSVVHRLSAPTFAESRRCVRHAVEFLAGIPVDGRAVDAPPAAPADPGPLGGFRPTPRTPVFVLPPDHGSV